MSVNEDEKSSRTPLQKPAPVGVTRNETKPRLTTEAEEAVRGYMIKLFTMGGTVAAIVAGVAGYMINDLAKANAVTAALQEIQEPLIRANEKVFGAVKAAEDLERQLNDLSEKANPARIAKLVAERLDPKDLAEILANNYSTVLRGLKGDRGEIGAQGLQGLKGDRGEIGERGSQGERGEKGDPGQIPSGAVMAFATKCLQSQGWAPYKEAEGRFILGVGTGPLEKFIGLDTQGGEEEVTLTVEKMPNHDHGMATAFNGTEPTMRWLKDATSSDRAPIPSSFRAEIVKYDWHAGEGESHNNMPPYIALYFCKKLTS